MSKKGFESIQSKRHRLDQFWAQDNGKITINASEMRALIPFDRYLISLDDGNGLYVLTDSQSSLSIMRLYFDFRTCEYSAILRSIQKNNQIEIDEINGMEIETIEGANVEIPSVRIMRLLIHNGEPIEYRMVD